jgi:hypothetical protein
MLGTESKASIRTRGAARAVAVDPAPVHLRLILSLLVAFAVALSSLISASPAHAALEGERAVAVAASVQDAPADATVAAKAVKADPADKSAPDGKFGSGISCTGHCSAHAFSLTFSNPVTLAFKVMATDWTSQERAGLAAWRPSSLDRPPRG